MSRQRLECHQARRTIMVLANSALQPRLDQCRGLMMILAADQWHRAPWLRTLLAAICEARVGAVHILSIGFVNRLCLQTF
jgi:hypothetical protein